MPRRSMGKPHFHTEEVLTNTVYLNTDTCWKTEAGKKWAKDEENRIFFFPKPKEIDEITNPNKLKAAPKQETSTNIRTHKVLILICLQCLSSTERDLSLRRSFLFSFLVLASKMLIIPPPNHPFQPPSPLRRRQTVPDAQKHLHKTPLHNRAPIYWVPAIAMATPIRKGSFFPYYSTDMTVSFSPSFCPLWNMIVLSTFSLVLFSPLSQIWFLQHFTQTKAKIMMNGDYNRKKMGTLPCWKTFFCGESAKNDCN